MNTILKWSNLRMTQNLCVVIFEFTHFFGHIIRPISEFFELKNETILEINHVIKIVSHSEIVPFQNLMHLIHVSLTS